MRSATSSDGVAVTRMESNRKVMLRQKDEEDEKEQTPNAGATSRAVSASLRSSIGSASGGKPAIGSKQRVPKSGSSMIQGWLASGERRAAAQQQERKRPLVKRPPSIAEKTAVVTVNNEPPAGSSESKSLRSEASRDIRTNSRGAETAPSRGAPGPSEERMRSAQTGKATRAVNALRMLDSRDPEKGVRRAQEIEEQDDEVDVVQVRNAAGSGTGSTATSTTKNGQFPSRRQQRNTSPASVSEGRERPAKRRRRTASPASASPGTPQEETSSKRRKASSGSAPSHFSPPSGSGGVIERAQQAFSPTQSVASAPSRDSFGSVGANSPQGSSSPMPMSLEPGNFQTVVLNRLRSLCGETEDAKVLAEYIVVMVAGNKSRVEMAVELKPFFQDQAQAESFVEWVEECKWKFLTGGPAPGPGASSSMGSRVDGRVGPSPAQAAVQERLQKLCGESEDAKVLAEYVMAMLAGNKSREEMSNELKPFFSRNVAGRVVC